MARVMRNVAISIASIGFFNSPIMRFWDSERFRHGNE